MRDGNFGAVTLMNSVTKVGKRWAALGGVVLAVFAGCSGKRGHAPEGPESHAAGTATSAAGGETSSAGEGGVAEGAGPNRAGAGGAGSGGAATAGAGATSTSGGAGTNGGFSGGVARGGGAGMMSAAGAGAGSPATGWTCAASRYGDGKDCDCGCGSPDPDCKDENVASCDTCHELGSCASGPCPSSVAPEDNSHCAVPEGWLCGSLYYGDGFCDCGCGMLDADCASPKSDACVSCPLLGCGRNQCATVDPDDNTICTSPPLHWKCDERFYRDGTRCDCGCGFPDPDCSANELGACDYCNGEGSCSGQPCPGLIDPSDITACVLPVVPAEWRCPYNQYGTGDSCDCGCGALDPDCRSNTPESCDYCSCNPDRCPESVDPENTAECAPPPAGWTCSEFLYANGLCDCGCGALDVDCVSRSSDDCEVCDGGCAHGHCERVRANDNTTCSMQAPSAWTCSEAVFWDDVCDCGCGALDPDCMSAAKSSCDACASPGSCSSVACKDPASTIAPNDNTKCDG